MCWIISRLCLTALLKTRSEIIAARKHSEELKKEYDLLVKEHEKLQVGGRGIWFAQADFLKFRRRILSKTAFIKTSLIQQTVLFQNSRNSLMYLEHLLEWSLFSFKQLTSLIF